MNVNNSGVISKVIRKIQFGHAERDKVKMRKVSLLKIIRLVYDIRKGIFHSHIYQVFSVFEEIIPKSVDW